MAAHPFQHDVYKRTSRFVPYAFELLEQIRGVRRTDDGSENFRNDGKFVTPDGRELGLEVEARVAYRFDQVACGWFDTVKIIERKVKKMHEWSVMVWMRDVRDQPPTHAFILPKSCIPQECIENLVETNGELWAEVPVEHLYMYERSEAGAWSFVPKDKWDEKLSLD